MGRSTAQMSGNPNNHLLFNLVPYYLAAGRCKRSFTCFIGCGHFLEQPCAQTSGYNCYYNRHQMKYMYIIFQLIPLRLRLQVKWFGYYSLSRSGQAFFKKSKNVGNLQILLCGKTQILSHFFSNGCHSWTT